MEARLGDGFGHETGRRGSEERLTHSVHKSESDQFPNPRMSGDEQPRRNRLRAEADEIGGDQDPLPGQSIPDDAADEQEHHERYKSTGKDESERGRGAINGKNGECQGDRHERVPEERERSGEIQPAKLRLG